MRVFYNPRMIAKSKSFSPSPGKPKLAVESWKKMGWPIQICGFTPASYEDLYLAHSKEYIDKLLKCEVHNGFGNNSPEVAKALPWVSGAVIAASLHSFRSGESTFAPCSGSHHAHWNHGGAFCSINYEVVAALKAKQAGAKRVGIISCDAHFCDGTASIIEQLGLDFIQHYSFGKYGVRPGDSAREWLKNFPEVLLSFEGCDLILYAAGADAHINDDLGSGSLTTAQFALRESYVFETMNMLGIPVVVTLAGGYKWDKQRTIRPVLDLHDLTFKIANEVYGLSRE